MTGRTPSNALTFAVSDAYLNYVLFIQFVVYGLSYVDRKILKYALCITSMANLWSAYHFEKPLISRVKRRMLMRSFVY